MTNFDPLAMSIIAKAVDFLFNEASKILQQSRSIDKDPAKKGKNPKSDIPTVEKNSILNSITPDFNAKELKHCLNLIDKYTKNVHAFENQIAIYGGKELAPPDLVRKLEISQETLKENIYKLKDLLEKASNQEILLPSLE